MIESVRAIGLRSQESKTNRRQTFSFDFRRCHQPSSPGMTKANFKIEASRSSFRGGDADLNSPLTTRLLSAYYYLLPLQMAKRSPTGRSWNAFLFSQVLTAFRPAVAFPKWRHEWPQVQIMIRGTTSASRRCNRLLRSCYRPRSILPPWAFHLPPKRAPPSYTPPPSAILPFTPLSLPSMLAKFLFAPALRLHPLEFPIYHRKLFDLSLSLSLHFR